jgi:hypothetical protein
MIGVLLWVSEYNIWGRLSTDSEQNLAIGREIFSRSICGNGLASKECGEFSLLIKEIRRLVAGFFDLRVRSNSS